MGNPKETDALDLVRLTDCADNAEAGLLQGLLEAEGIFVNLSGAHHRSLVTAIGSHIRIDVWVQKRDLDRAKALLAERDRGELAPADPEALAAEAEAAEGPEVERLELGPEPSEAQLAASARRRRRMQKLGAWMLLVGPLSVLLVVIGYQAVVRGLRLDWATLKQPQFQVRFPLPPTPGSKTTTAQGKRFLTEHFTSYQAGTDCAYRVVFISPPFGDALVETRGIDGAVKQVETELGMGGATGGWTKVDGFPARALSGSGRLRGMRVESRYRWIAAPKGTLIQSVVCSEGRLRPSDAEAFFSSLVLTAG